MVRGRIYHFITAPWFEVFKETPSGQLIETNRHARLFCSKQLLNDVIFIRFIDKKAIHIGYTEKFNE